MRQEKGAGSCLFRICAPSGLLSIPVVTPTGLFTLAKAAASSFHPSTSEGTQVLASPEKHWQVASCRDTEFYLFCLRAFPLNPQIKVTWDFPGGSDGKESACNAGDFGSIPGLGRSPGEGHGNPLQYSCLENSMDRGPWWTTVHGVTKESDMTEQLTLNKAH